MLKSKSLTNYKFPYAIFVSKLIDYFEVNTTNERNETIKVAIEIDNATLTKMGFQKQENAWVHRRNVVPRMEHEGSNCGHVDEDDDAPHAEDETVEAAEASCYEMRNSSPHRMHSPTPSMKEEFTVNDMNALVAYHEPKYCGEPLSNFKRQVLYHMDYNVLRHF